MIAIKNLKEKISARLYACRDIAEAITQLARHDYGTDKRELLALSARIATCADPRNHVIIPDAANHTTGELYDSYTQYWNCGSKLCPTCLAKQARRTRKKLRDALARVTFAPGERLTFVTFTVPNTGQPLLATRDLVNRAWTLFRKRKLCASLIRGGVKSEEFTLTAAGYHYHLHCIFLSRWIQYQEIRRVWTECVETAFREASIPFTVDTKDGLLLVKCMPVKDTERSVQEVCKYITKSDSWMKMNPNDLREIALIRRWNRMFELFGAFSKREASEAIVHTRDLSDASSHHKNAYWRDRVLKIGLETYLEELSDEVARTIEARRREFEHKYPWTAPQNAIEWGVAVP